MKLSSILNEIRYRTFEFQASHKEKATPVETAERLEFAIVKGKTLVTDNGRTFSFDEWIASDQKRNYEKLRLTVQSTGKCLDASLKYNVEDVSRMKKVAFLLFYRNENPADVIIRGGKVVAKDEEEIRKNLAALENHTKKKIKF